MSDIDSDVDKEENPNNKSNIDNNPKLDLNLEGNNIPN